VGTADVPGPSDLELVRSDGRATEEHRASMGFSGAGPSRLPMFRAVLVLLGDIVDPSATVTSG